MVTRQQIIGFLSILAVLSAETSAQGNLVLKSYQRARQECQQYLPYLDDSDEPCQSRCEMIVLRSWDDCSGLLYIPFSRHFQPGRYDDDYLNRTLCCQNAGLQYVPDEAVCSRASVYWRCYRDQWGYLTGTPQLVPLSNLQIISTIEQCSKMLQVNSTELDYFAKNNFDVSDRSRCLMRCILIRQGMYSDASGPDLERMFVQCGGYDIDEQSFKQNASECVAGLRDKCYDKCMLATRIVNDCFPRDSGLLGPLVLASSVLTVLGIITEIVEVVAFGALLKVAGLLSLASIFLLQGIIGLQAKLASLGLSAVDIDLFTTLFNAIAQGSAAFGGALPV